MRILNIFIIVILILVIFYSCFKIAIVEGDKPQYFDIDKNNYAILSGENGHFNYLKNGIDHKIEFGPKDRWARNFAQSIFMINEDLVCLALGKHINYYDSSKGSFIRSLVIDSDAIATKKNSNGDLIIFSGGSLYEYDFRKDVLTKLKDVAPNDLDANINNPSLFIHPDKISYSKIRNSVFYSAFTDPVKRTPGIYEMSLKDYSVNFRGTGFCPQVDDNRKCVYYINYQVNGIVKSDFNDFKEKVVIKYLSTLRDMVVIDEKTIFFSHDSEKASIKGMRFDTYKVYDHGEIKPLVSQGSVYRSPFDVVKLK